MKWIFKTYKKKAFKLMMKIMIRLKPKETIIEVIKSIFLKTNEFKNSNSIGNHKIILL